MGADRGSSEPQAHPNSFADRIIDFFSALHPLDRVQRAGYVLRGVTEPETVASHAYFVSLLTLFVLEEYPTIFEREKALGMALLHDIAECRLMDIPMPVSDVHMREAKNRAELAIAQELLRGFPDRFAAWFEELEAAETPEARLVRGLDKAQMMIKVLCYEEEQRGRLAEFWENPNNFRDYGLSAVAELFDAICARAGRPRPR